MNGATHPDHGGDAMRILIEVRPAVEVTRAVEAGKASVQEVAGDIPGVWLDEAYSPVIMPRPLPEPDGDPLSLRQPLKFSYEAEAANVLVRGEICDDELTPRLAVLSAAYPQIVGIFSDPKIHPFITCGSSPAVGTWTDVARSLATDDLLSRGLDGSGVLVAVVDFGINRTHLSTHGQHPHRTVSIDELRSWSAPGTQDTPGRHEPGHGTMCAFNVLIGAPQAKLLDISLLNAARLNAEGTLVETLSSDAVESYEHLRKIIALMPSEDDHALVVTNSWGLYSPLYDFPPGHPGNYTDNAAHPLNRKIAELDAAGADVLFAVGNCGHPCPHTECAWKGRPIVGANSHPQVLSVGGVDLQGQRVGYSAIGPGRLAMRKPDLCAYTHFLGSEAMGPDEPDKGTSTACPVVAGVVAAVRAKWSAEQLSPERLRRMLQRTALDPTGLGFSEAYGFGIVNVPDLLTRLDTYTPE